MFFSNDFDLISNDNIYLKIIEKNIGNINELPYYYYDIYLTKTNIKVGKISIRIGHNYHSYFNGNIGYEINEEYRGNKYASKAVQLIIIVAKHHKMNYLILTCDESNIASYKSIESLSSKLLEVIKPPLDYIFYYDEMEKQRIYKFKF